MRRRTRRGAPGLTLVEIMVATAILSIVATMIWASFDQENRSTRDVEASQERYHEARVALSVITRDLASAFLSKHVNMEYPHAVYAFMGVDRDPIDRLDFVSFSHRRRIRDSHESDQCEVGYYGAPDPEDRETMNLVRRESPILDDEPDRGGHRLVLARGITEFDLTYYDREQEQWVEAWDTTQASTGHPDRLPDQVRVLLTLRDERGRELTFTTQTPIHLHEALLFGRRTM